MSKELKNTQNNSQRANDYDLYIFLLEKRKSVLNEIKNTKSLLFKKDKNKQLAKLNDQIGKMRKKLGL